MMTQKQQIPTEQAPSVNQAAPLRRANHTDSSTSTNKAGHDQKKGNWRAKAW